MDLEEKKLIKRLERARESGKLDEWELCCRRLAELRASHGNYEGALRAYEEELSVSESKGDAASIATSHRMVGEMHSMIGQFSESLDHVNKYLTFARSNKNAVEEQRALATIGRTYFCWATELKFNEGSREDQVKAGEVLKECRKAYMKSLYICEQELKDVATRERQEMKARILFNLGLACEIEEDYSTGLNYVAKSIAICKQESLLEDLHRCYISQGTLLFKQSETSASLAAIDQACEVAKKLPNVTELTVLALLQKAEVYFAMGNYTGAKTSLKKAYKLNSPNEEDKKSVITSLKRAVQLCDLEAKLIETNESSLLERKGLYEKLGDTCCSVKNYKHALQCYLNMLDCAISLGQSGKDLQPCYVSLYQTYRDDKKYDFALEYARKELEVSGCSVTEAAKSHIAIGEILELKGASYYEVSEEYLESLRMAVECGDVSLQALALKRLYAFQITDGREELASETKKELDALGNIDTDGSQSEEEDSQYCGVNLSDLSESEDENSRARPSRNTFKVTRNEKGETPLHVAAIRGDVARAQRLLSLGHPVKERDLAGWTPLHEAANHGHIEMVRTLLKAGADVNDPGGRDCGGVTPLHDAASCGHFDVVNILLEHKASVTVLTNTGETPLDCLKEWRKRVDNLSQGDELIYEQLIENLDSKLSAAGFQRPEILEPKRKETKKLKGKPKKPLLNLRRDSEVPERRKKGWGSVSPDRRRNTPSPPIDSNDVDIFEPENVPPCYSGENNSATNQSPIKRVRSPQRSVADYRAAIEAIRNRSLPVQHSKPRIETPLLDEHSYVDEWLEDDLRTNRAQKKKRKGVDLVERSAIRPRRTSENDFPDFFFPHDEPADFPHSLNEQSRKKVTYLSDDRFDQPKLQTTLITAGFSAVSTPPVVDLDSPTPQGDAPMDFPSLPSPPFSSVSDHVITKVRVNVGRFTLLVPVDSGRVDELTVRWLAEEAAKRYCELEGAEPQLLLKTRDGAMLAATDPVSVALGEDLDSAVVGWNTASLTERYRDAVSLDRSTPLSEYGAYLRGPDIAVLERLAGCDSSRRLDLNYMALTNAELNPVLKALKHEKDLRVLNLSGNALGDAGLDTLVQCLEHCSVEEINLRCNNITATGFNNFVNSLNTMNKGFLSELRSLDISFNPIGRMCVENKEKIYLLLPNLSEFKTESCESFI